MHEKTRRNTGMTVETNMWREIQTQQKYDQNNVYHLLNAKIIIIIIISTVSHFVSTTANCF